MNDGWIPFSCLGFRVLVLCMLAHCHTAWWALQTEDIFTLSQKHCFYASNSSLCTVCGVLHQKFKFIELWSELCWPLWAQPITSDYCLNWNMAERRIIRVSEFPELYNNKLALYWDETKKIFSWRNQHADAATKFIRKTLLLATSTSQLRWHHWYFWRVNSAPTNKQGTQHPDLSFTSVMTIMPARKTNT